MNLLSMKQEQKAYLDAAKVQSAAGNEGAYASSMTNIMRLQREIEAIERSPNNTIRRMQGPGGVILADGGSRPGAGRVLDIENARAFHQYIASGGRDIAPKLLESAETFGGGFALPSPQMFSALYEGSNSAGGYAVPITVDDQIVPLAPNEMSVRRLAQVIPTRSDIKFPVKGTFSTATAKAETSSFTESEPTLTQFTLSAFMAGVLQEISWELAQDVPAFQAFAVDDMILAQQMYEENLYVNGTGSGQAQGLIGNVANGGTYEPDSNGNNVSITGILSLIGGLKEAYQANASFLMARPTSIVLRKAQMLSNLFFQAYTSVGGQDYLFGYPVFFSSSMPAASRGNAPVIFGDFKRGYLIGDRGGSGINVKVLDQPLASQGILQLLAYRRTDGRVRRSEALQQYNISAS